MNSGRPGHWAEISQRWSQVGPPLRPSEDDVAVFAGLVSRLKGPRALIFGVTPELFSLPWPDHTDLRAIDNTRRMIDSIWQGAKSQVICGDWRALPLRPKSRDVVLCDGGFHLVSYPHGQRQFAESVRQVLAANGFCAIRLFVPPETREDISEVLADLLAGRIANLNFLKLRLGMAMQENPSAGVRLGDVWSTVDGLGPWPELAERIGWPLDHLRSLDSYKDSDSRYCFVTPNEVEAIFTEDVGGFEREALIYPSYPLGERCPIIVFRRVS